jgi:tetratricopeptide (TPR) repeat protein
MTARDLGRGRIALMRWCALLAAFVLGARSAGAAVVIESYVGPRPGHASEMIGPLIAELEALGVTARPAAVYARAREQRRAPGVSNPAITLPGLIEQINKATDLLQKRSYRAAADQLEASLADAYANVAVLVTDPAESRTVMMDAWIGLTTCRARLGEHVKADEAMQEVARSFPNQETNIRNGYGAEPAERYQKAMKQLQARGAGKLIITTNDPSAVIYLDEWLRPQNAILEADVLPGAHRVLVKVPGTSGWRYDVVVEPDKRTQIDVDVRFEVAVMASSARVGFSFPSAEAARRSIGPYTRRLIALDDDELAIVVSLTTWNGGPAVMASTYRMAGAGVPLRGYLVALDGSAAGARLRALAHALVGREDAELELERSQLVATADPFTPPPIVRAAPRTPSRAKWPVLGGAILAAGAGAALVYFDNQDRCGPTCPTIFPTKPYGYASLSIGAAMATAVGYLLYRDERPRVPSAKWMLLGGAAVTAGTGAALVYLDNQDRCGPACPTLYPTKPYGYASIVAAGAMAATASYLFYRDARRHPPGRPGKHTAMGIAPSEAGVFLTAVGEL